MVNLICRRCKKERLKMAFHHTTHGPMYCAECYDKLFRVNKANVIYVGAKELEDVIKEK